MLRSVKDLKGYAIGATDGPVGHVKDFYFDDQRWTLTRVRDLVARRFGVQYTIPGVWHLLRRRGWSCQMGRAGPSSATTAPSRCGRRRPGPG